MPVVFCSGVHSASARQEVPRRHQLHLHRLVPRVAARGADLRLHEVPQRAGRRAGAD